MNNKQVGTEERNRTDFSIVFIYVRVIHNTKIACIPFFRSERSF